MDLQYREGEEGSGGEHQDCIMPPPWERYYDEDTESYCYFNAHTGQQLQEEDLFEFLLSEGILNNRDDDDFNENEEDYDGEDNMREREEEFDDDIVPPPPPPVQSSENNNSNHLHNNLQDDENSDLDNYPPPPPQEERNENHHFPSLYGPDVNEDLEFDLLTLANMDIHGNNNDNNDSNKGNSSIQNIYQSINDPTLSVIERSNLTLQAKNHKIHQQQLLQAKAHSQAMTAIPVTSKKAQLMPKRSVEDILQWEEERQQRLHRTKTLLREKEEAEVTGKPTLTKKAEEIAQRRMLQMQAGTGGDYYSEDNQSVVTSNTQRTGASSVADRLWEYEEKKKEKRLSLQQAQENALRQSAIPKIAPKSNKILAEKQQRDLLFQAALHENLHARNDNEEETVSGLISTGQKSQQTFTSVSHQRIMTQHDPETGQRFFEPKLNPVSETLAQRRRRQQLKTLLKHNLASPTNNNFQSFPANDNNIPIEDLLHAQGMLYQQRLADKEQRRLLQEEKQRKVSKVNPQSAKIVEERYILHGETTQDRLQKHIGTKIKAKTLATIDQPTFTPKISDTSLQILQSSGYRHLYFSKDAESLAAMEREKLAEAEQTAGKKHIIDQYSFYGNDEMEQGGGAVMVEAGQVTLDPQYQKIHKSSTSNSTGNGTNSNAVYERSKLWELQRQRRLERDRVEMMRREKEICSFKPKVSNSSNNNNTRDISERHQQWLQQKEAKLQRERAKHAEEAVKECTFVPKVPIPSKALKVTPTSSPGRFMGKSFSFTNHNNAQSTNNNVSSSSTCNSVHSGGSVQGSVKGKSAYPEMTGYEDFAIPFSAVVPKSPVNGTNNNSVKFRTKSAAELLQVQHLESPGDDGYHYRHQRPHMDQHHTDNNTTDNDNYVRLQFPPSQLRYGGDSYPASPMRTRMVSAQYEQLRARGAIEFEDHALHTYHSHNNSNNYVTNTLKYPNNLNVPAAVHTTSSSYYTSDMASLEELAQASLVQQQQHQHYHIYDTQPAEAVEDPHFHETSNQPRYPYAQYRENLEMLDPEDIL